MEWFIPLAAKSVLIAGGALLLLKLLKNRSAADRSWIAHLALAGLLLLPIATFALPTLDVAGPEFLVGKADVQSPSSVLIPQTAQAPDPAAKPVSLAAESGAGSAPIDWPFWGYLVPAALLVLLTLIALTRLFILKARATVLVDAPWLTALARAQHRMGFKHGTALLTSDELPSPISWGVVRPVILLNSDAAQAHNEAEAIITHELAHVARLDWAKLLLSRVAVALFWFNPLVWVLAREAHQLREEAADDAVLATDIDETDYARLLVGVARHECRGLLIGAHGVAPARNSLARRVKRVLDGAVKRAPGGWRWGSAAAFFAAGMAVPVAALNLVPAQVAADNPATLAATADPSSAEQEASAIATLGANDSAGARITPSNAGSAISLDNAGNSISRNRNGEVVFHAANGSLITVSPPDARGNRRTVLRNPDGNVIAYADASAIPGMAAAFASVPNGPKPPKTAIDRAIELKAVGASPEYIAAIRAAAPQLHFTHDDIVAMKSVGVTPSFISELGRLGYRAVDGDEIVSAYSVGVREDYVRGLAAAGYGRLTMEQLTQLRAVGVTAADLQRFRQAGFPRLDVDKAIQMKSLGITPEELKASEDYGP